MDKAQGRMVLTGPTAHSFLTGPLQYEIQDSTNIHTVGGMDLYLAPSTEVMQACIHLRQCLIATALKHSMPPISVAFRICQHLCHLTMRNSVTGNSLILLFRAVHHFLEIRCNSLRRLPATHIWSRHIHSKRDCKTYRLSLGRLHRMDNNEIKHLHGLYNSTENYLPLFITQDDNSKLPGRSMVRRWLPSDLASTLSRLSFRALDIRSMGAGGSR